MFDEKKYTAPAKNFLFAAAGLAVLSLANARIFSSIAFFDFDPLDWGGFLDAAWRIWCGQRIYVDYAFHTGPVHLYMFLLFFKLFGFDRQGILMHLTVINTLTAAATFAAAWGRMPLVFTALCTLLTLAGFYWIYPHPYYDYSAHFFGLLGVAVLARTLPFEHPRAAWRVGLFCGVTAAFCGMTKINIGAAYGLVYTAVFLTGLCRVQSLAACGLGLLAGLAAVLATLASPAAFFQNLAEYSSLASDRLTRFLFIPAYFKNFLSIPAILLIWILWGRKKTWEFVLCLGVGAMAIFTVNTGSFRGWDYLPMIGMYMALSFRIFFGLFREPAAGPRKAAVAACILVLSVVSLYQIFQLTKVTLARMRFIRNLSAEERYELKNGPFQGWVFKKNEGEIIDGMIETVRKIPPQETLLMLSNMQMLYPFAEKESYKGIPFQWFEGRLPPLGKVKEVRQHIFDHPPDWILASHEEGKHPVNALMGYLEIPGNFLFDQYDIVKTWSTYALFRRRPGLAQ